MLESFLRSQNFARLLALILAVILWLFVQGDDITRPAVTEQEFRDISLEVVAVEEGVVVKDMPSTVALTLKGSRSALARVNSRDVTAYVDLEGKGPGEHRLPVRVRSPADLDVVSLVPSRVSVIVESADS